MKVRDAAGEGRRVRGELVAVDERGVTVEAEHGGERVDDDRITHAHTVFEWGAPTKDKRAKKHARKKQKEVAR